MFPPRLFWPSMECEELEMNHFHEEACESVDAAVFSGDIVVSSLEEFKVYLGRWNRAVEAEEEYRRELVKKKQLAEKRKLLRSQKHD